MTEKEQFDSLMNLLVMTLQLQQSGVLTPSESTKEAKAIYTQIKDLMGIRSEFTSTFKV